MSAENRCHWLIDLNRCLQQWGNPIGERVNGHCTICSSLWTLMWPNSASELIYTHSINNNIHGIICSAELKTPIVSPMDCVYSHGASHRKYAAYSCCCCCCSQSDGGEPFYSPPSPPPGPSLSPRHLPCSQWGPLWPVLHTQLPATHSPCPLHCGSIHCEAGTSHSVPFQPL